LYDLEQFDADCIRVRHAKKAAQQPLQNDEESEIEKLCDEERYLDLNKCLEEEMLNQGKFLNFLKRC
jgi:hypothetical protein